MKKLIVILVFLGFTLAAAWAFPVTSHRAAPPAYEFHSTSTYSSPVGSSAYSPAVYAPYSPTPANVRRTESWTPGSWDEDGDEWDEPGEGEYPAGVLPDPAPVGEPFFLLCLLFLYAIVSYLSRKRQVTISQRYLNDI